MIHSNSGLRIEDYEEYFKRKHADSNCGFAEDYEVHTHNHINKYINVYIIKHLCS